MPEELEGHSNKKICHAQSEEIRIIFEEDISE